MILLGIIATVLILECTAFNYRAYPNRGEISDYPASGLIMHNADDTGVKDDNGKEKYQISENNKPYIYLEFEEQKMVNTVYVDFDFYSNDQYRYAFNIRGWYHEESRLCSVDSSYELEVIPGDEYTKYFLTDFNHAVDRLQISLVSVGNYGDKVAGLEFGFGGIGINHKMPFHFSLARVLLLSATSGAICLLAFLFIDRKEIIKKPLRYIIADIFVYALPIIVLVMIFAFYGNFTYKLASATDGTQISKELVDAFMKGHLYLDAEPSESLKALSNPYDYNLRWGVDFLWDHLYYNGKYYSYYGIAPVFLLFLPFRLIFGKYLYDAYGVLLFSIISLIFMALTYENMLKLLYKDKPVPRAIKYPLYWLLALGCGILFNVERPYFYEVSTSAAFMCMMIMLYHLTQGGILFNKEDKKYFYYHLFFASLWCALGVLSRATMALYALCHLIYLGFYYYKHHQEMDKKANILFFALSLSPYLFFGLIQGIYNYLRFGSFLDFGIEYSLTIADFKNMPFHFGNVITSVYNFLFGLPVPTSTYFFMYGSNLHFGSGFYYFETYSSVGLFFRMPILWLIFVLPFINPASGKERLKNLVLRWLPCVIIPFIQVCITWQSGYATRYFSDFAWPLSFFAVLLIIKQYQLTESERAQKGWFIFLVANILFSSFVTFDVILVYVPMLTHHYGEVHYAYTRYYYHLGHELVFWR